MTEHRIKENKRLVERYPFLLPRNRFTDEPSDDYDYTYTELDAMPDGWIIAFGEMMCEEIREALLENDLLNSFRIDQLKEKYGSMRLYHHGGNRKADDIINKYSILSENICSCCGRPDSGSTKSGWIYPVCEECWNENQQRLVREGITKEVDPYDECCERGVMQDEYSYYKSIDNHSSVRVTVDISETANKIRENWEKNNDNRRK